MSRRLVSSLRALVAEDLAGPEGSGLVGNDRREYARQQIFLHLDGLTGGTGAVGPVQSAIGAAGSEELPGGDRLAGPSEEAWDEQRLAQAVLDGLFGMGGLQTLIDDSRNREHRHQWVRSGLGDLCRRLQAVDAAGSRF